jgi:8-oxo-dGTP diphosphatase
VAEGVEGPVPQEAPVLDVNEPAVVRAAGGVVVRGEGDGREVALVHRPKYDDWSLPKGKLLDGEPEQDAALREVEEETGIRCRLGPFAGAVTYADRFGRPKVVRYWLMTPQTGAFVPGDEVDEIRWLPVDDAEDALTYPHDRKLLHSALGLGIHAPLYVVRHAKAGTREGWAGRDEDRPLTARGRRQARRLVERFRGVEVERIVSSTAVRCVQSVEPLAVDRGLAIEIAPEVAEGVALETAIGYVRSLEAVPIVLSAHGREIEALVRAFEGEGAEIASRRGIAKGSVWVFERAGDRVVSAHYLPAPSG